MILPRPYQRASLDALYAWFYAHPDGNPLLVLPTGAGKAVILALTISPDGRAAACRIYRSSGLPETDAVTCRLAMERLRFRPATNAAGDPVSATFYWQQKFFF